jgi:hypothetical protein
MCGAAVVAHSCWPPRLGSRPSDLVVRCTSRRLPLPRALVAVGARRSAGSDAARHRCRAETPARAANMRARTGWHRSTGLRASQSRTQPRREALTGADDPLRCSWLCLCSPLALSCVVGRGAGGNGEEEVIRVSGEGWRCVAAAGFVQASNGSWASGPKWPV